MKQKKLEWPMIVEQLAQRSAKTPGTQADEFWKDFHLRRHLYPQAPKKTAARTYRRPWLWSLGGLAATSLVAIATWFIFMQPTPLQANSSIHSYEITPEHGSVMILQSESNRAIILWVSNLNLTEQPDQEELPQ